MTKSKNARGALARARKKRWLACAGTSMALWAGAAMAQSWTHLATAAPEAISYIALGTDGSVIAQGTFSNWYKLTPDTAGSYVNGSWSRIASPPSDYTPWSFAGGVLADGKLLVEGGMWNGAASRTTLGALYDPVADSWVRVSPPQGWSMVGEAPSVILADGTFMMGALDSPASVLFDQAHLTWTPTGSNKAEGGDYESWALLPDGKVLNVLNQSPARATAETRSQLYDPATGAWSDAGSTLVQLGDSGQGCDADSGYLWHIGPLVLRPDGTVLATGANSCGAAHSAVYDTRSGTWKAGPDFPDGLGMATTPAAVETNGNVLLLASPGVNAPSGAVLEWDGARFSRLSAPSVNDFSAYASNLLQLPNGQILLTTIDSTLFVWTPAGTYQAAWRPTITSVAPSLHAGSRNNAVSGTQFNGLTAGAYHGDVAPVATNFPLLRLVHNASGTVTYGRTHDHSSMGVQTGSKTVSTWFDLPDSTPLGASTLYIVANGIPSAGVAVDIAPALPDYSLTATNVDIATGGSAEVVVMEKAVGGFDSPVALSVSGLPQGISATFVPASITGSAGSGLDLVVAPHAIPAASDPLMSQVTVTGKSASGVTRSATFNLTLHSSPAGTLVWNVSSYDFGTLSAMPNSAGVSVPFTLTNTGSDPVRVFSVATDSIAPAFVSASDCAGNILQPGARCSADVVFVPSGEAQLFTGTLTATDTAYFTTQSVSLSGRSTATGFNIAAPVVFVTAGQTATATLTQTVQNGFNSPVTLSAAYLPDGVTATFSPSTLSGAGTSTVTYSVSCAVTSGGHLFDLLGTSTDTGMVQVAVSAINVSPCPDPIFAGGFESP